MRPVQDMTIMEEVVAVITTLQVVMILRIIFLRVGEASPVIDIQVVVEEEEDQDLEEAVIFENLHHLHRQQVHRHLDVELVAAFEVETVAAG